MSRRVLVIGGAGAFGSRLVRALAANTGFDVLVGGRSEAAPKRLAAEIAAEHHVRRIETVVIDRDAATADTLAALELFAVVDAAGPFQAAAAKLAEAAIGAGIHYVDIADARAFVAAFPRLDAAAEAAGVVAITGASSTPAISHAALDRLTRGWGAVDTVEIAITPGNRAPRGLSVVAAILSYAGRPVRVFLDGEWRERPGWGLLARKNIPGLGRRWLALCETPDLDLVPARLAVRRAAIFRAGLELSALHLGLWAAALPVRAGLLRSLAPFARPFRAVAAALDRLGTDRGGMLVEAAGEDPDGQRIEARWTLIAEAGDGPSVPILPVVAILRRLAEGRLPPGARACAGLLDLSEIEAELRPYRTTTRIDTQRPGDALFVRALGERFAAMPAAIQAAHRPGARLALAGEARVDGAERMAGRLAASLFGLPKPAERVPVRVVMERRADSERWTRTFGGRRFASTLRLRDGGMTERFGPFTFDLEVPATAEGLDMRIVGWRIGPLPLPRALAPWTEARERVDPGGRFSFDVTIGLPFVGRLVRYRSWLVPEG